jgi:hypothetical protein
MNQKTEVTLNQIASDLHLLTWPIRFVLDFIKTCIFAALFIVGVPLISLGLLIHHVFTGQALLDADAVLVLKVLYSFCIPFILPIVYRFAQMGTKMRNRAAVKAHFYVSMHWIFLAVLVLELLGALVNFQWWSDLATERGLATLVLYLASPLLLLLFTRDPLPADLRPHQAPRRISAAVVWVRSSEPTTARAFLCLPPDRGRENEA